MTDWTNDTDITEMPYAEWLEETLREISGMPIRSMALVANIGDGFYTSYYECNLSDKILFSGVINQDAMMHAIEASKPKNDADDNGENE